MKTKRESYFWTGYSDLMTSLFFVMLVLFALAIAVLQIQNARVKKDLETTERILQQIKDQNTSIRNISQDYFSYNEEFKRHTLKDVNVTFRSGSSDIADLELNDLRRLLEAGRAIRSFMIQMAESIPQAQYLVIIEGQSSRDNYSRNYELSYERALALVKMWERNKIYFEDLSNCEIIISGSGQSSRFRLPETDESGLPNEANQRFVIHVIPKPGVIE